MDAIFAAFLKCPTKAHLLAIGEPAPATYFTDIEARISSMYKSAVTRTLLAVTGVAKPLHFGDLGTSRGNKAMTHPVDCETTAYNVVPPLRKREDWHSAESTRSTFVPVLFSPWDKAEVSDSLLVCFGALALSQVTAFWQTQEQ
jgi:hypothetical protein